MTPQMIFEEVNRAFDDAIYVTDVGQAFADVGNAVSAVG